MQYTPSMIACWANQEIMSGKVNLYASGLVRALFPVFQSRGPRRDRPPADCSYPGLAWHTELGSNAALLTLPVTSGSGKRFAAASRDGPPLGSDGRSWPSSLPGPFPPSVHSPGNRISKLITAVYKVNRQDKTRHASRRLPVFTVLIITRIP